jgi:hypothetical protein
MSDKPYQILNVLEEATSQALMTLDEMKILLAGLTTPADDARLTMLIDQYSATIATLVQRSFGFAKVTETFYNADGCDRLYFSQWPVKYADIETITVNGADILTPPHAWTLEEKTGTLMNPAGWYGLVDTIYSGGYHLPDEAPDDLKAAASVVARESYYTWQRGMLATGVRSLSHKGNRIQFQSPTSGSGSSGGSGVSPATMTSLKSTLSKYNRIWI